MSSNGNKTECRFSEEILSYIYDEMPVASRGRFESHLAGCMMCTDEFATISEVRFSVFEWQKEEFSHLATPRFSESYRQGFDTESDRPAGILSELAGLWAGSIPRFALAGALLVLVAAGFLGTQYLYIDDKRVATIVEENVPAVMPADHNSDELISKGPDEVTIAPSIVQPTRVANRPVSETHLTKIAVPSPPASGRRNLRVEYPKNEVAVQPVNQSRSGKPPALSSYEDNDDRSLRLADLFEDGVGGAN